mmetsp:Transcript_165664/g.531826  ORF Transcript_165664/g.531826 Transcript_165664/m.531826 type:complete len:1024 (+) Transcript_165664:75-3146(+)|eukprot:CAMPEP_0203922792 /NCGR_PEP_ID=MMETSP0359-20131031/62773_1 /ASSEMBLY_ACC=CAM_ASM_000338 /TAXON_ID=268821 /ORGANISM="Scrippsiella Hangoei, Strain SHTV-5" /LENGTH=1023 /DNA_ID=CAMNT_0050850751 /DNA_START=59 /DNA_END=3130 /DNA_ORIENTATION=+
MAQAVASVSTRRLAQALGAKALTPQPSARRWAPAVGVASFRTPPAVQQRAFFWSRSGKDDGDGKDGGDSGEGKKGAEAATGSGAGPVVEKPPGSANGALVEKPPDALKESGGAEADGSAEILPVPVDSAVSVDSPGQLRKDSGTFSPQLMVLPLPRRPLFPGQQQILHISHPDVAKEIRRLLDHGTPPLIGAFLHKNADTAASFLGEVHKDEEEAPPQLEAFLNIEDPIGSLYHIGTRARVVQAMPFLTHGKDGITLDGMQLLLQGIDLITLDSMLHRGPPLKVQVSKLRQKPKSEGDKDITRAYINETMHTIREIMKINPQFREHAAMIHQGLERLEKGDPHAIAHFAASLTTASGAELMTVLETEGPSEKLRAALELVKKELELSQLQQKIAIQIEEKVSSHQREFMLREQMKMIKKELGEDKSDGTDKLMDKFKKRLEGKTVPKEVQESIEQEMEKFSNLAKESQEYQTTRNYLDWLTMMPWGAHSEDTLSLIKARQILDRDHYGLNDVKERIQELIAVGSLRGSVQGKILCLVGPPGVGKTSIGRSIAEALGREYYRFSVGGLYDVAEIKGHRRTYVGAMPGKIVQALKKVQSSNPLVLIDEVDKIGRGHQGDPASALLELLDPSQNSSFMDHYLDVPVDCSRILFVCTANVTDTIPGPLLDRMEVIRLSGYDLQEKVRIAEDYLVPNSMREAGLWPQVESESSKAPEEVVEPTATVPSSESSEGVGKEAEAAVALPKASIDAKAIESLIRWYCREAGVRNLQKQVEKICRKLATQLVEHREKGSKQQEEPEKAPERLEDLELHVTEDKLKDYVGKPVFLSDRLYEGELPAGTVLGLAWTSMGGTVLYIEAMALARGAAAKGGAPSVNVTGQLGSVMKESSQIALLNARRQASARFPEDRAKFFEEHDIHVHCPEGATPKDGPSAGVTMTTALLSLALDRPARADLAMTGEVSLNGKVLPVGGIKEKTIAARRAGCKALIYPQANQRDFDELPEYLREGLEVHFATSYDDVFKVAFPEV